MSIIITASAVASGPASIERVGDYATVRYGYASINMSMSDLRDLCNDIAEVLDVWFEERDRAGK